MTEDKRGNRPKATDDADVLTRERIIAHPPDGENLGGVSEAEHQSGLGGERRGYLPSLYDQDASEIAARLADAAAEVVFPGESTYNDASPNPDLGGAAETPSKKQWQQVTQAVLRDLEGLPIETIEDVRSYIARVRDKPPHVRDETPKKREERRKAEKRERSRRQGQRESGLADAFDVAHSLKPAELWADRDGTENPVEFIQRVYEKELGRLTRAVLSRVDYRLYQSYAKWLERHPTEAFRLPTQPRSRRVPKEVTAERIRRQRRESMRRLRERRMH